MASGHAHHADRSNTWPHRPALHHCHENPFHGESSTRGTIATYHLALVTSAFRNGGIGLGYRHGREADLSGMLVRVPVLATERKPLPDRLASRTTATCPCADWLKFILDTNVRTLRAPTLQSFSRSLSPGAPFACASASGPRLLKIADPLSPCQRARTRHDCRSLAQTLPTSWGIVVEIPAKRGV